MNDCNAVDWKNCYFDSLSTQATDESISNFSTSENMRKRELIIGAS